MKKIITLVVATLLAVLGCLSFTACGKKDKDVLKVINYSITDEQYAFAVAEGNTTLKNSLNAYLSKIKGDGTFDAIVSKYNDGDTAKYKGTKLGEGTPGANDLVILTNTPFEPFEFQGDDDKYYGIDMEIAAGFAEYLGKNAFIVEWLVFDTICDQASNYSGTAGAVVAAGLSVDGDREAVVDFSNNYYDAGQYVIAKAEDETFKDCKSAADVENVLKALTGKKIGYQNGTTGAGYVTEKLTNVTASGFATAALAAQALINGSVDYVIVDGGPANAIVKQLNSLNK